MGGERGNTDGKYVLAVRVSRAKVNRILGRVGGESKGIWRIEGGGVGGAEHAAGGVGRRKRKLVREENRGRWQWPPFESF